MTGRTFCLLDFFTAGGASRQYQNPSFWQWTDCITTKTHFSLPPLSAQMLIASFIFRQDDNQPGFRRDLQDLRPTHWISWVMFPFVTSSVPFFSIITPTWHCHTRQYEGWVHKSLTQLDFLITEPSLVLLRTCTIAPSAMCTAALRGAAVKLKVICKWLLYKVKYHSQEEKMTLVDF